MIPSVSISIDGKVVTNGLQRLIDALSPDAQQENFRKIVVFVAREVRDHTPGSGVFRAGWRSVTNISRTDRGWKFEGSIFNVKEKTRLTYRSALSGEVKPKLDKNDKQQTYGDIMPIMDKGSKPHVIKPRRYPTLIFRSSKSPGPGDPNRSNVVFAKEVKHPGTKAYGMLSIPRKKLQTLARAALVEIQEQVIRAW